MLNVFLRPLPDLQYGQAEQYNDLMQGVNLHEIRLDLTGSVTVAGGTVDGAVVAESPATLIDYIRIVWDNYDIVQQIPGEDLVALTRRCVAGMREPTTLAGAGLQTGTAIRARFVIPFARPYLANPYDTVLPALPVRNQFRMYVKWATDKTTTGSDAGSAAIIRGGDRAVTFSGLTLKATQVYSTKPFKPWYIPVISVANSDTWAAANTDFGFRLLRENRFDAIMFRALSTADRVPADVINSITFGAGNQRYIDNVPWDFFETWEQNRFPGVPGADTVTAEAGTIMIPFADGGKLTNVVNPAALRAAGSDPKFTFDVDAPASGTALIRATLMELITVPGITQVGGEEMPAVVQGRGRR